MLDVEGFILVGGASSRMGRDKSRLMLGSQTTVERIAEAMAEVATRVRLVGRLIGGHDDENRFESVPDLADSWGPLGGIQAALHAAEAEWCLVIACDLPFVSTGLLRRLLELRSNKTGSFDAVVPIQADDYPQPLCAAYRRLPCLDAADQSIRKREHSPRELLDKVNTRYVPFAEISDLTGASNFFFNINTPENYERAQSLCQNLERRS
ncbi:MAG TPA: molybdenum cofactor guanylyltransferase [Pyrinomonadaceae bacterium]|nr:molybdenum cofactor guanylyltransferase [Pyrinomonadaceae bacterium]